MLVEVPIPVPITALIGVQPTITVKAAVGSIYATVNRAQAWTLLKRMRNIRERFVEGNWKGEKDWDLSFGGGVPGEASVPFTMSRRTLKAIIDNEPALRQFIETERC